MPLDAETVLVARVLGARQLAQTACVRTRSRRALLAGAAVDAAHAASMLGLSAGSSRAAHRTLARRNARTAVLLAAAGVAAAGFHRS